ncbi:MAG TPA: Gfo/Idh/MocA family oxidoreductase [Bacteroidales bacterium]|nr:MAG: 1,5-anhydro-D-fructose reductase [Bacteroidetes bacterium ADurb.Bin041]HNV50021.1 Gfo/Idh/MocA family oxidoreductase [Bacteroidales bacterium]HOG65972.1 Gfo/Idh/MocA family oxidoreductase [Bacteroidales bacterium]HPW42731.1 Gfo/Idh/MocA family oxidoreductase [Bacteroidales bacterium]HQF00876.1 Gfo/Idh/MocA family oxidoreductase [Bacteroidales bacterium]
MDSDNTISGSKQYSRREILAGLASIPVIGVIGYGLFQHINDRNKKLAPLLDDISSILPKGISPVVEGETIRLGIVGTGSRGKYLMKALGFLHPSRLDQYIESAKKSNEWAQYLNDFYAQEDLNIEITAICDVFDKNANWGVETAANIHRNGTGGKMGNAPKRFLTYQELVASPDVDAVIIATPDHLHIPVALEAVKNNKHIYCEKPLSCTVEETFAIREAVKESEIIFQLGHQGRQTENYHIAKSLINIGVIGKISLIEVCTNRNDPNGAWVYEIDPDANENTIDWKQFIGPAPWHEFSLERFFRWRCWWDYSTGLSGDLFTHEYDALNQILGLGIPHSATASGGIYYYKDGRTVPDVLNMAFEYPNRELTLLYSATLASEKERGKVIMGHDAYMELDKTLLVVADPKSTRYKEKIEKGIIEPHKPIFSYVPGQEKVDAITTPTEKYFAGRGLLYTYRDGKSFDTSHLHLREWLNCIRLNNGLQPSCDIDQAFEEAITAHMGTISYLQGRRTYWDADKQKII